MIIVSDYTLSGYILNGRISWTSVSRTYYSPIYFGGELNERKPNAPNGGHSRKCSVQVNRELAYDLPHKSSFSRACSMERALNRDGNTRRGPLNFNGHSPQGVIVFWHLLSPYRFGYRPLDHLEGTPFANINSGIYQGGPFVEIQDKLLFIP